MTRERRETHEETYGAPFTRLNTTTSHWREKLAYQSGSEWVGPAFFFCRYWHSFAGANHNSGKRENRNLLLEQEKENATSPSKAKLFKCAYHPCQGLGIHTEKECFTCADW